MIIIHTKQNTKGSYWAYTTFKCYDYSAEAPSVDEARQQLSVELKRVGAKEDDFVFTAPVFYPIKQTKRLHVGPPIGYATWRIDKGMV